MKTVIRYKADDGTEWTDEASCLKRDALIAAVADATAGLLMPRPDAIEFDNGHGFVRHSLADVRRYKVALLTLAQRELPSFAGPTQLGADPDQIHPMGIVCRWLDECSPPIARAWHRLMCIDSEGREWGQPYYAMHPEHGEAFEVPNV